MPKKYKRHSVNSVDEIAMVRAVEEICDGAETPTTAARKYGLKRSTIIYRLERKQKLGIISGRKKSDKIRKTKILTDSQEAELVDIINRYTYLPYDASGDYKVTRQLIYQYCKEHNIRHPKEWDEEMAVSVKFLAGFARRNTGTYIKNVKIPPVKNATNATNKLTPPKKTLQPKPMVNIPRESLSIASSQENNQESTNSFQNTYQSYVECKDEISICDTVVNGVETPPVNNESECQITVVPLDSLKESQSETGGRKIFSKRIAEKIAAAKCTQTKSHSVLILPKPGPQSQNSFQNSYQSHLKNHTKTREEQKRTQKKNNSSNTPVDSNETIQIHMEPECQITLFPFKDEADDGSIVENLTIASTSDDEIVNGDLNNGDNHLEGLPGKDDVFNSFGRNIAFQVKELHRHSQVDAFNMMHQVQTLVSQRLMKILKAKVIGKKYSKKRPRQ